MRVPFALACLALVSVLAWAQRGTDVRYVHLALTGDSTEMVVAWFTQDKTTTSTVFYGSGETTMTATGAANQWLVDYGWNHFVTLTNLIPGETYWYVCGDVAGGLSPKLVFKAAPPKDYTGTFSIGVVGDMGIDYSEQTIQQITKASIAGKFEWFLHIGDIGYADDHVWDFQYTWNYLFDMIEPVASAMPYMVLPGNHEYSAKNYLYLWTKDFKVYNSRFLMPGENSRSNTSMYYSFDYGLAHFICYSTESSFPGALTDADMFGDQLAWIEADLKKANEPSNRRQRPWIIVSGHRPMYSSNPTYSRNGIPRNKPIISNSRSIQEAFEPLFMKYGVNLVFQGHVHAYERTFPVYNNERLGSNYRNPSAPVYITTGNGGNLEGLVNEWTHPKWSAVTEGKHYGYGILIVHNATHLEWQQFAANENALMDRFVIERSTSH